MTTEIRQPVRWMIRATVISANIPLAIAYTAPSPVLAKMSAELAHSAMDAYLVKMTVGILGLAMIVGAPIAGFLADKIGRRAILTGAGLLFAVAGIVPIFVQDIQTIVFSRIFVGFAAMAFGTLGATIVGDYFGEEDQPHWMGILVSAAMFVALFAVPIAGFMGDYGWRWPFLLNLVGLPVAVIAWLGVQSFPDEGASAHSSTTPGAREKGAPIPMGLLLVAFVVGICIYTPAIYAPFRLRELGIEHPSSVGLSLTVNGVIGAVVAWFFGWARRHYSARMVFCFSFGVFGIGMAVLALVPTFYPALVGLFFIGIGMAWMPANAYSLGVAGVEEHSRGRIMGLVRSAEAAAPAIGITVLEPWTRRFGFQPVLLSIAGVAVLMAGVMAIRWLVLLLVPNSEAGWTPAGSEG
jgi:MFS family permease